MVKEITVNVSMATEDSAEEKKHHDQAGIRSSNETQQKQGKRNKRSKKNSSEAEVILNGPPRDDGEISSASETGSPQEKSRIQPHGRDDLASVRRRHNAPKAETFDRSMKAGKSSKSPQREGSSAEKGFFPAEVAQDIWNAVKGFARFSRASYSVWRYVVLGYLILLGGSYFLAFTTNFLRSTSSPVCSILSSTLSTVCSIWIIGPKPTICKWISETEMKSIDVSKVATSQEGLFMNNFLGSTLSPVVCSIWIIGPKPSFCKWISETEMKSIDVSKLATTQEGLTVVMDRVGENFDLAREMTSHEFAIANLKIRVTGSKLPRRGELAQELGSLSKYTGETAETLSDFTAKFNRVIGNVHQFDVFAVKRLEAIAEREKNPPSFLSRSLSALNPLNAFTPSITDQSEREVKDLFIGIADEMSTNVKTLIDDSFELKHGLNKIKQSLLHIGQIMVNELADLPHQHILSALWTYLARVDDYRQQKSHTVLLEDMEGFYERFSSNLEEIIAALNRFKAALKDCRDEYATPALILRDHPLEMIVALLRKAGERLEAGKEKLESIEDGGARPKMIGGTRESTRTVLAISAS